MMIENVTPGKFLALRKRLTETHQAQIAGNSQGVITGHGVTANFLYNAGQNSLSVEVLKHPFFIPVSTIEEQLRDAVDKS